ncbi:MAG: valine--tRNA ligase, partial [Pseudomonadota bacterium]|nr:valine--tRNA ligase [Pseudomonadota bacterium]
IRGNLWHLRYPIEGSEHHIVVATTRPETMLGDVAVAVNPSDERYRHLVGQHVRLPIVGRLIPIIADAYSDPEKGSGAVKITPAHDFNDFQVGQRHGLAMPSVLDREGRVTLAEIEGGDPFLVSLEGQDRFGARRAIVAEFERLELLDKVEPHTHQVPHGDRSGVPIEPLLTTQWYCNAAELAKPAIAAVESGRTRFVPQQWENTFYAWMRDIQPWCISRQLWWGHRIPAWFGPDGHVFVAHDEAGAQAQADTHYGRAETLAQDEDVLDTWFSSGLWPFSTLGWPDQTPELARYYPGDVLVTGFDIIFFWVARMMMMGHYVMGDVPFRDVYIHGLVRDERGQKMSKSKGNVIDPLELIGEFGTDALRFTVCALTGPGRDIKLGRSTVESYRSFVTKIWNAARFCEMNQVAPVAAFEPGSARLALCRWMLDATNRAIVEADAALEAYRFNDYASVVYRVTWNAFCDWFLEFAKPVLNGPDGDDKDEVRATAAHVLGVLLRLLHPAMPFVTEHLWSEMGFGAPCSLIRTRWPQPFAVHDPADARDELDWVVRLVGEVRAVRAEMNVPPSALAPVLLRDARPQTLARAQTWSEAIRRMARADRVGPLEGALPPGSAQAVVDEATVVIPLAGLIDLAAERARLERDRGKALGEAEKIVRKLENADFVSRAKPEVVEETRERLAAFEREAARLGAAIGRIAMPA